MSESSETVFGLIIAFALPGFLALWGVSYTSADLAAWLKAASPSEAPTVGAFLYLAVASLSLGLLISAVRWATLEQILYVLPGMVRSTSSENGLTDDGALAAYQNKINNYYRYYQCYSHCLIAVLGSYAFNLLSDHRDNSYVLLVSAILGTIVLFLKSRNELRSFNIIREELLN